MCFEGVGGVVDLTLPRAVLPLAVEFLLTRDNVDVVEMLDEVVHVHLFWRVAVFPKTAGDLGVVGRVGVLGVG